MKNQRLRGAQKGGFTQAQRWLGGRTADVRGRSHNFDDHLSRRPPGLGVGECITHLVEPKDLIHQRSDGAAFHQPRNFSQLFSIGMHEQVLITGLAPPRCSQGLSRQHSDRESDDGIEPPTSGKRWGRGAAVDAHHHTARFHALEAPHQSVTTRAVQHQVNLWPRLQNVRCDSQWQRSRRDASPVPHCVSPRW